MSAYISLEIAGLKKVKQSSKSCNCAKITQNQQNKLDFAKTS